MIETREAVANMDAILDVPGIAGVYIGPSDLGYSHGLAPKLDREEPEMLAILDRVVKATTQRGLHPCLHCGTAEYAVRAIGMGFHLVTISSDSSLMFAAAKATVAQVRRGAA
jgi:4-hydroxy-2-oxoheptanedioate aldolase